MYLLLQADDLPFALLRFYLCTQPSAQLPAFLLDLCKVLLAFECFVEHPMKLGSRELVSFDLPGG